MVSKFVKNALIAIAVIVIVTISVAVVLNQLTNNSPGSPFSDPVATPTQKPTNPSLSPTSTSNPTSTNPPQKTPTPKPDANPTSQPTTPTQTQSPNPTSTIQPTQVPIAPTETPTIPPTLTPTIAPTPTPTLPPLPTPTPRTPITMTFDFDTATPIMRPSMNTPFSQTLNGVIAQFSSPSDPAAFSIQTYDTTLYRLSQFSGNYISDNRPTRDIFEIRFNQQITSITFTFATFEYHGAQTSQPSYLSMTAYMDSTANQIGTTTARGTWPTGGNAFPQGTLTYNSANPFNFIRVELPYQGQQSSVDYLIDNIIITTS